ncbi:TPA: tail fiber assembly protein [Escherichia coli]|nr:tail fiber assembly protein [Escherichia coli]
MGWSYSDGVFTAPPPPERSHNALVAEADLQKSALLTVANNTIAPLQDAVDLEMATDDEQALLLAWKKYRVLLNRVDTSTAPDVEWPAVPVME